MKEEGLRMARKHREDNEWFYRAMGEADKT